MYRAVGEWDKTRKKSVKKTLYVGSISLEGVFAPKKERPFFETNNEVYEYGNSMLALRLIDDCRGLLGRYADEIVAMSMLKALDPCPLRLMQSRWQKYYASLMIDPDLRPSSLSHVLREMGKDVSTWYRLFSSLTPAGDLLLYDLTCVFTRSEKIKSAGRGYNKDHVYVDQVGVVMAFSTRDMLPVGLDVFNGSLRDVSTISDFVERLGRNDIGFVLDTGFYDQKLLGQFRERRIQYVVPLTRNSNLLEVRGFDTFFQYRDRGVQAMKIRLDDDYLYVYRDPLLRGDEESTLIKRLGNGLITKQLYDKKMERTGIIGLRSSFDDSPEKIYDLYKGREDVEQVFDSLKNTLESDKTYMQSQEAIRGYMLITFLASRIHYKILKRLKEADLLKKTSVEEVLSELSKIEVIKEKTGRQYYAKIPKKARELESIFPESTMC